MRRNPEQRRLEEDRSGAQQWRKWGPYLSDRQWGTVREDYSADGSAWEYFPHDHARSRAYRWGEDGIAGITDDNNRLCFSLAMWNGKDPILKERYFGLTGNEGNHGEDCKEVYYYLDATPTHSYLKMLYKYPQEPYPYAQLVQANRQRGKTQPEFEIVDTGVFDEGKYFDVFVEYGKAGSEDILIQITVFNRSRLEAPLHLLPQVWFRNTWSWGTSPERPYIIPSSPTLLQMHHPALGTYYLHSEKVGAILFCDNETNAPKLYNVAGQGSFFKDGFHEYLISGDNAAINPAQTGTKAALHYLLDLSPGTSATIRLRLCSGASAKPFARFQQIMDQRKNEADAFYAEIQAGVTDAAAREVQRQAWAGMIWNKQYFYFNVAEWLAGDPGQPAPAPERRRGRNADWMHHAAADVISMPDKWEYPWYAAWDLAFQCIPFAMIDPDFAKRQLILLTKEKYMHPNGQLPAYEWHFGDVNPPVQAWGAWQVYQLDRQRNGGKGDATFLETMFHKLLLNFTWWVNRKDMEGRNIFQGGFLGLDNIGVFDRSDRIPTGGYINQCDGTSWMAMYCLNLMRIALELSVHNAVYQNLATKFFEHFLYIADALTNIGGRGIDLWSTSDEFYYDVLSLPDGADRPLRVRSMVGLIPLFAVEVLDPDLLAKVPKFTKRLEWFLKHRPDLANLVSRWHDPGRGDTRLLSLLRGHRMKRLLKRMLDESEFLSPYGIRALSRVYSERPYVFESEGQRFEVRYEPGESDSAVFGGNSNWRGPIWMPVNFLIVESLRRFHQYYGDDFTVECPMGSGQLLTLHDVADEIAKRVTRVFLPDESGLRPVLNSLGRFATNPNFKDYILFYECFHGDTGRGVGASHQTGWTALIAALIAPHEHPKEKRRLKSNAAATAPLG